MWHVYVKIWALCKYLFGHKTDYFISLLWVNISISNLSIVYNKLFQCFFTPSIRLIWRRIYWSMNIYWLIYILTGKNRHLVHGDIKAKNILIDGHFNAKVSAQYIPLFSVIPAISAISFVHCWWSWWFYAIKGWSTSTFESFLL